VLILDEKSDNSLPLSRGGVGIPQTGLTTPHLYACLNSGAGYPSAYIAVYVVVDDLR
jgi:hypothetical protein